MKGKAAGTLEWGQHHTFEKKIRVWIDWHVDGGDVKEGAGSL